MPQTSNIHEGHRKRLKQRYVQEGLDSFNEINVLELLLFYCVQRKDTNPLAHRLLDYFGDISKVLTAPPAELMKVEGVTEHVATYLSLISDVCRYHLIKEATRETALATMSDCANYMLPFFHGLTQEVVFLLCLDAKQKVLCCKKVGEGSVNSVNVSVRKIVETALVANASAVVLAHNHPSGFAVPSEDDKRMTQRVAQTLSALDIILCDHLVFADDDYVSLAQTGLYSNKDYLWRR